MSLPPRLVALTVVSIVRVDFYHNYYYIISSISHYTQHLLYTRAIMNDVKMF